MQDQRLEALQSRVAQLELVVEDQAARLALLERRAGIAAAIVVAPHPPPPASAAGEVAPGAPPVGVLPLAGRLSLLVAGAFLLRAITEAHLVSPTVGAVLGLLYAAACLAIAERGAARDPRSATAHGIVALAIALPLVWEETVVLGGFGVTVGLAVLLGFFGLTCAVAWRRDLIAIAAVATVGAALLAMALAFRTDHRLGSVAALFVVAACVEVAGARRAGWRALRWPVAIALDVLLLELAAAAADPSRLPVGFSPPSPLLATLAALALPTAYLFAAGAELLRRRTASVFAVVQGTAASFVGLHGATRLAATGYVSPSLGGVVALALATAAAVAAALDGRRRPSAVADKTDPVVELLVSVALLHLCAGTGLLLGAARASPVWVLAALGSTLLARRLDRPALLLHAPWLLGAAVVASPLGAIAWGTLWPVALDGWAPLSFTAAVVALACPLAYALAARPAPSPSPQAAPPRALTDLAATVVPPVLGLLSFLALVGLLARAVAPLVAATEVHLAAARTTALCLGVVAVAATARLAHRREARALVYPLLVVGALRVLAFDLPTGHPSLMFVSLGLLGSTALTVSRLLRRA